MTESRTYIADELADKLMESNSVSWGSCTHEQHDNDKYFKEQAATMLRQQAALLAEREKITKHRNMSEQMEKDIQEIVDFYMQFVTGEHFSIRESLEYFWKCMNDYTIEDYLKTVRERKASEK